MGFKEFQTLFSLIPHEFSNVTILDAYAHIICRDGFHKLEKIKDGNRRSMHLRCQIFIIKIMQEFNE